jgi:hypothetical protein
LHVIRLPGSGEALLERVNLVEKLLGRRRGRTPLAEPVKRLPRQGRLLACPLGGREALLCQPLIRIKGLPQDAVHEGRLLALAWRRISAEGGAIQVGETITNLLERIHQLPPRK